MDAAVFLARDDARRLLRRDGIDGDRSRKLPRLLDLEHYAVEALPDALQTCDQAAHPLPAADQLIGSDTGRIVRRHQGRQAVLLDRSLENRVRLWDGGGPNLQPSG